MREAKRGEEKNGIALLEKIDKEENEARINIFKIKAITELAVDRALKSDGEEHFDWLSVFQTISDLAGPVGDRLDEINMLTRNLKMMDSEYVKKLGLPAGRRG